MSTNSNFDRIAEAWLAEGPAQLADRVLDAALDEVHLTDQRRRLTVPWRTPTLSAPFRVAAAIAIVAIVGVGGYNLFGPRDGSGTGAIASPSPSPSPTIPPTLAPTVPPLDTSMWRTFTSTVYGFTMGYPADWRIAQQATRPWVLDDGLDWGSPGVETFTSPEGDVAVSAWGIAVDPSPDPTIAMPWEDLEAWIEAFCKSTGNGPCTGIHDRVVPMCPDADTECHTGAMIVPFEDDVAGFKGGDRGGVTIVVDGVEVTYWVVISVWQPESFPSLAKFGGGTRLIQAFLESMGAQMPSRGPVDHSNHP